MTLQAETRTELSLYMSKESLPTLFAYCVEVSDPAASYYAFIRLETRIKEMKRRLAVLNDNENAIYTAMVLLKDLVYQINEYQEPENLFVNWARRRKLRALIK